MDTKGATVPMGVKRLSQQVDEEQMLDIAEICFVRVADQLIKFGLTVRECFGKFAISE